MNRTLSLASALCVLLAGQAHAHAIVGDRVFPATLEIDDPGVNDELNLPQISRFNDAGAWTTTTTSEFDKRITDNWGMSANVNWADNNGISGLDNYDLGTKYVFLKNPEHEAMMATEVIWEIGNSGAKRIANNFSTLTPSVLFGRGMGDLPDSMDWLKPFAVTGALGITVPTERYSTDDSGATFNPNVLQWGFTLQYSLPYLQQHVKDVGLGSPFNMAIPIVEFSAQTPTDGDSHMTTGYINPGVLFMGNKMQVGVEAMLPLNHASGDGVGFVTQLHFYLDDIFPASIGRTLW